VVTLRRRVGLAAPDGPFEMFDAPSDGYRLPIGLLADGVALASLSEPELRARAQGGKLQLRFASGVELSGQLARVVVAEHGGCAFLELTDYQLGSSSGTGCSERGERF